MTNDNDEDRHSNKYIIIGVIIILSIIIFAFSFPKFLENPTMQGNGYSLYLKPKISLVNRYNLNETQNNGVDGFLIPHSAGFSTSYFESFESGSSQWSATTLDQIISAPRRYIFDGSRAYYFSRNGNSSLNKHFNLTVNETMDLSFYIFADTLVQNGYLAFGYSILFPNSTLQFEYVLSEGGSGYINSSKIINSSIKGFIASYYTGFLIKDVRLGAYIQNDTVQYTNITLSKPYFKLYESNNNGMKKIYMDYIQFQNYTIDSLEGLWYDQDFAVKTDYMLTINYDLFIDANVIDQTKVSVQLEFDEIINVDWVENLTSRLFQVVILDTFTWTSVTEGIFNKKATGTFYSHLHPLPVKNYIGTNLTYYFTGIYTLMGDTIDGQSISNSVQKSITGFQINFTKPLKI